MLKKRGPTPVRRPNIPKAEYRQQWRSKATPTDPEDYADTRGQKYSGAILRLLRGHLKKR